MKRNVPIGVVVFLLILIVGLSAGEGDKVLRGRLDDDASNQEEEAGRKTQFLQRVFSFISGLWSNIFEEPGIVISFILSILMCICNSVVGLFLFVSSVTISTTTSTTTTSIATMPTTTAPISTSPAAISTSPAAITTATSTTVSTSLTTTVMPSTTSLMTTLSTTPASSTITTTPTTTSTTTVTTMMPTPPLRVFITNQTFTGDLGITAGLDENCNTAAQNANLGGVFLTWISIGSAAPATRTFPSENVFVRIDGTIVAIDFSDLLDGNILAPINVNEYGDEVNSTLEAWTNTNTDGTSLGDNNCDNWGGGGGSAVVGSASSTTSNWTNDGAISCTGTARLYCIEDPTIPPPPMKVFVTNGTFDANFSGIAGADNICNNAAQNANLAGVYLAWLSQNLGSTTPASRFVRNTSPYVLTNGIPIADDFDDLIDGTLSAPIIINENGQMIGVPFGVWTNTGDNGFQPLGDFDCEDWLGTNGQGNAGSAASVNFQWSIATRINCDSLLRLYCFEQPPSKIVFVTNQTYDGNLGGLAGGDAKCNSAAQAAGLSGNFRAWLSVGTMNPSNRFVRSPAPYILVDNTTIATNFDDLVNGSISAPIDKNENGVTVNIWTATFIDGLSTTSSDDCGDWTSTSGDGVVGSNVDTNLQWTFSQRLSCSIAARLFCFEQ